MHNTNHRVKLENQAENPAPSPGVFLEPLPGVFLDILSGFLHILVLDLAPWIRKEVMSWSGYCQIDA